ncbi:hypothetical protein WJ974_06975 [Achromobacter xylosoxidans]
MKRFTGRMVGVALALALASSPPWRAGIAVATMGATTIITAAVAAAAAGGSAAPSRWRPPG